MTEAVSTWFSLFADLDLLSNPDATGYSADELLNVYRVIQLANMYGVLLQWSSEQTNFTLPF